jgi:hypothetical protein
MPADDGDGGGGDILGSFPCDKASGDVRTCSPQPLAGRIAGIACAMMRPPARRTGVLLIIVVWILRWLLMTVEAFVNGVTYLIVTL